MSFWKKLFGGSADAAAPGADAVLGEEDYKGFTIRALHMPVGAEFQLAGTIEKEIGGEVKVHRFVRADRVSSREDLVALALFKGRRIVDEQGERLFS